MGNPTKKLPLIERDDWLLPVEATCRHSGKSKSRPDRSSITPTAIAISDGSGTRRSKAGGSANGFPGRRTFICWATSTAGSALRCGSTETRKGCGVFSCPMRCMPNGSRTAHSTKSTCTATTAGTTASPPMRPAWYRMRKPRISPPSSGIRSRSTGRATAPLRPAARSYSSTKPT